MKDSCSVPADGEAAVTQFQVLAVELNGLTANLQAHFERDEWEAAVNLEQQRGALLRRAGKLVSVHRHLAAEYVHVLASLLSANDRLLQQCRSAREKLNGEIREFGRRRQAVKTYGGHSSRLR